MSTKVDSIKNQAVEKLNLDDANDYCLVELKSDNGKRHFYYAINNIEK